jgi:isoleucyl-tRNA synthetase
MSTEEKKSDYKASLNLPTTDFAMKAELTKNEPARLARWQSSDLYGRLMKRRAAAPKFIVHDGPPFANGDIHIGHVVNKTLKDVVMRYRSMAGFQTPYVPGYDCHGLPIEHRIQEELGPKWRDMAQTEIRQRCFDWAQGFVEKQSTQFQRVGILGDWSNPYRTMAPEYEAATLEIFARHVEKGLVYRQLKPVNWSLENQTALADADLEYKDVVDTTVFVEFASANPGDFKTRFDLRVKARVGFLIWTTTPWTLPANLAIAVGPDVEYSLVKFKRDGEWYVNVVATELVEKVFARATGVSDQKTLKVVKGRELEGLEYSHPFADRRGTIVLADYVTTTDGTGLVHTAPGPGEEDYQTGRAYKLDVYCPVLANGRFDSTVPGWLAGLNVWKANDVIVAKLAELGVLFASEKYSHSYPHDARSKKPTIYRATEQWFVSVDKEFTEAGVSGSIRGRALKAIENDVTFYPDWGRARLKGMLESRPDWVLSRQRAWGLPMPIFFNEQDQPLLNPQAIRAVARHFRERSSNCWFDMPVSQLLAGVDTGRDFPIDSLRKGNETFDVWFESGSSWFGVVEQRSDQLGQAPVDLYLEGSDQHRGWFQLSMLTSIAVTGRPPYKAILTHGFVVKPDGTKVSKSDKEYVTALDEINRHGADLIRLYVSSLDYQGDMPASPQMISEFGDKYRKIRNTIRYLLSNIDDYDPGTSPLNIQTPCLDLWMLDQVYKLYADTIEAYEQNKFHIVFKQLFDFCNVQVSAIYGNAMKDRLYCERKDSPLRRRAQGVMYQSAVTLIKLLAPLCVFTADEAWEHLKHKPEDVDSVHLASLPSPTTFQLKPHVATAFDELMTLRDAGLLQLDQLKKSAGLNKALDAEAVYRVKDEAARDALAAFGVDLEDVVGCGFHSIVVDPSVDRTTIEIVDRRQTCQACARSWKRRPDVGSVQAFPDLSARDAQAVA